MTNTEQKSVKKKSRRGLVWGLIVVFVLVLVGTLAAVAVLSPASLQSLPGFPGAKAQNTPKTAPVTSITAVTSVTSAGSVAAVQSGAVVWKTTGQVTGVYVKPGDRVKAGDVLMILDPYSAPQNVIQAGADLISSQKALDDLLHPTELAIANARKNVANAQDKLDELLKPKELTIANARQTVAKAQDTLDKQARWLQQYARYSFTVEGHADERGTREYNIALGQRRAEVAKNYLVAKGIPAGRMRVISYGKERPVAVCDDISCWSQNRRAVTVLNGGGNS